jgi:addiction module HigA family antidote
MIAFMQDPAHPGEILAGWIDDLNLSVTAFAAHVGVSRVMLSRILNGRAAVSADMDLRLSEALGTAPGFWLQMQAQRDLWQARQRAGERPHVERLTA